LIRLPLLYTALASLFLTSCGWTNSDSTSDTLDVGIWERPISFDPHRASSSSEKTIATLLYPGLVALDASGQVMPALAESWDISPDGLTYIFRMRDKEWSDDDTLNAEDVVLTFRRLFDGKSTPATAAQMFDGITNADIILQRKGSARLPVLRQLGVRALADDIVEIKLAHPEPTLLQRLALPQAAIVPMHVQRRLGKDMFKPSQIVTNSGYKLELDKDLQISVRRLQNPATETTSKTFNKIRFHIYKDPATALTAFANNKIAVLDVNDVPTLLLEGQDRKIREQLHTEPSWSAVYLAANAKTGPMADRRVRLALAIATNQQLMVEAAFPEQRVQPLQSLLPPLLPSYGAPAQSDWMNWSDAQRSVEIIRLLNEAGYSAEKPLRLHLLMTRKDADQRIAQALQDQWGRYFVQLDVKTAKSQSEVLRQAKLGGIDLAQLSLEQVIDSPEEFLRAFGCKTRNRLSMMICNSEADVLLEQAKQLNDIVQRMGQIKRVEQLLLADVPVLPLYVPARRTLVSKSISGWVDGVASVHPLSLLVPAP
jgi:oligopeptide transport system substrate-binding protein